MIFSFKNKEYCLADWRTNFHTDMFLRYLINPITGKIDKSSYIGLIAGRLGWFVDGVGELEIIYNIHKEIFPHYSIDFDNLKQGQEDLDRFLMRVNRIKSFI